MTQAGDQQVRALEDAIMARAEELAQEFRDKAAHQRDTLLRDAAERLHLAEEREVLAAKADAERHFRRVTQASELRLQARLDQLRWELVKTVEGRLRERMDAMRKDRDAYRDWLTAMIREAAEALPDGELGADMDADDLAWVAAEWQELVARAAPERTIKLNERPTTGGGGVRIYSTDNRAQLDNRFEGRLARHRQSIQRAILQRLFPTDIHAKARNGGPQ